MFDKNKISVSEKLVKLPKLKRASQKKNSAATSTTPATIATTSNPLASNQVITSRPLLSSVQLVRRPSLARPSILRNRNHSETTRSVRASSSLKTNLAGVNTGAGSSNLRVGDDEGGIDCDSTNVINEHYLNGENNGNMRTRRNRSNLEARRRHRTKRNSRNTEGSTSTNAANKAFIKYRHQVPDNNEETPKRSEDKSYEELNNIVEDLLKTINQSDNNLVDTISVKSAKQSKGKQSSADDDLEEDTATLYLKNENQKEETNLNEPNMVALASSLPSNQSLLIILIT